MNCLRIDTPLDAYLIRMAYREIMAKKELEKHFSPVMSEDRAYSLGLLAHHNDETKAMQYVEALVRSKADKHGSRK